MNIVHFYGNFCKQGGVINIIVPDILTDANLVDDTQSGQWPSHMIKCYFPCSERLWMTCEALTVFLASRGYLG